MSTTVQVNMAPESYGQRLEREKLEASDTSIVNNPYAGLDPSTVSGQEAIRQVRQDLKAAKGLATVEARNGSGDGVLRSIEGEPSNSKAAVSAKSLYSTGGNPQTDEASNAQVTGRIEPLDEEAALDAAAAELANALPTVDAVLQNPSLQLSLLTQGLRAPRDPDLAEFKKEVIAALKHMGCDTRKFFGV